MTDLIPTTATPIPGASNQDTADGAPFVAVYTDRDTGRAIVALDRDAADALLDLLVQVGPGYDLTINPGVYGLDQGDADRLDSVRARITGPLGDLLGYHS